MHIYNTFLVLKELLPVFPIAEVAGHAGRFLDEAISVCLANEKRRDLAILGGAYVFLFRPHCAACLCSS